MPHTSNPPGFSTERLTAEQELDEFSRWMDKWQQDTNLNSNMHINLYPRRENYLSAERSRWSSSVSANRFPDLEDRGMTMQRRTQRLLVVAKRIEDFLMRPFRRPCERERKPALRGITISSPIMTDSLEFTDGLRHDLAQSWSSVSRRGSTKFDIYAEDEDFWG